MTAAKGNPDIGIEQSSIPSEPPELIGRFSIISKKIDSLGAESRGIERVQTHERDSTLSKSSMFFLWCSGCGSLTSASGFFLGPIFFDLSLRDSLATGITGASFGALFAAYASTLGPRSGLRQMVGTRFFFGWYFSRLCCLLNFISTEGFSVINCVFGGQLLRALSNDKVPLEVGIIIIAVISVIIAVFGIRLVHIYEKVMAIPVVIFFLLSYVCASSEFDNSTPSQGSRMTIAGNGLSFFTVCFGVNAGWASIASDYYILFPENTSIWITFGTTFTGIALPSTFVGSLAICIATGYFKNIDYQRAYDEGGTGELLAQSLSKWKGGGKLILVILFMSLISNNILNTYSIPLTIQVVHKKMLLVPRWLITIFGFVVYLACSLGGRDKLSEYLNNFLPMIGFWIAIYITIVFEEIMLFRKYRPFEWNNWNDSSRLTSGFAAITSFIFGVAGAVLGMSQAYYTGPIAKKIGKYGGDVGLWLCIAFTAISYPVFRYIELSKLGK